MRESRLNSKSIFKEQKHQWKLTLTNTVTRKQNYLNKRFI